MLTPEQKRRQEKALKRGRYYDPKTNREYPLEVWENNPFWRSCDAFVMEGAYMYARRKHESPDGWAGVIYDLRNAGLSREQVVRYLELFDYPHYWDYDTNKTREELLLEMVEKESSLARSLLGFLGFLWFTDTNK